MVSRRLLIALTVALGLSAPVSAQGILLNESFSTYSNGDLVGQNGWTQFGASATVPLQVQNGQLVIPQIPTGGGVVDNQDAYKSFTTVNPPAPANPPNSVFVGMTVTVTNAFSLGSFFFALSDTPTGFANERVTARDSSATQPGTFQLGVRVTGQAGYPYVYGNPLPYNTPVRLVVQAEMVDGVQNDRALLYVNPTDGIIGNQTPYAISTYTTGTGTDPVGLGVAIFSQFANAGTGQSGILIDNITVADNFTAAVPEPSTYALMAVTGLVFGGWKVYRRRKLAKK